MQRAISATYKVMEPQCSLVEGLILNRYRRASKLTWSVLVTGDLLHALVPPRKEREKLDLDVMSLGGWGPLSKSSALK